MPHRGQSPALFDITFSAIGSRQTVQSMFLSTSYVFILCFATVSVLSLYFAYSPKAQFPEQQ
jgi:uncharacterized membrane protein